MEAEDRHLLWKGIFRQDHVRRLEEAMTSDNTTIAETEQRGTTMMIKQMMGRCGRMLREIRKHTATTGFLMKAPMKQKAATTQRQQELINQTHGRHTMDRRREDHQYHVQMGKKDKSDLTSRKQRAQKEKIQVDIRGFFQNSRRGWDDDMEVGQVSQVSKLLELRAQGYTNSAEGHQISKRHSISESIKGIDRFIDSVVDSGTTIQRARDIGSDRQPR
jgi:hypothetical protein